MAYIPPLPDSDATRFYHCEAMCDAHGRCSEEAKVDVDGMILCWAHFIGYLWGRRITGDYPQDCA